MPAVTEVLGFLWAVKIPLVAFLIVWFAIRQDRELPESADGNGGSAVPRSPAHHPHGGSPRPLRRGPHGEPAPPAPARVRTVRARARTIDHW
jgi:hypothetical protein